MVVCVCGRGGGGGIGDVINSIRGFLLRGGGHPSVTGGRGERSLHHTLNETQTKSNYVVCVSS